jgi:hypothetical protein
LLTFLCPAMSTAIVVALGNMPPTILPLRGSHSCFSFPFEQGAAHGLVREGQELFSVDGVAVVGKDAHDVMKMLLGPPGKPVNLVVSRGLTSSSNTPPRRSSHVPAGNANGSDSPKSPMNGRNPISSPISSPFAALRLGLQVEQTLAAQQPPGESIVYSRPGRDASPRRDANASPRRNQGRDASPRRDAYSPRRDSYSPSRRSAAQSSPSQTKGTRSGERGVGSGGKYSPMADSYSSTPPRNMDMGKVTSPRAGQRQMSPSLEPGGMSIQAELLRLQVRFPVLGPTPVRPMYSQPVQTMFESVFYRSRVSRINI